MLFLRRSPVFTGRRCLKFYSTPAAGKTNIQLVAELRKLTSAPITKARQALTETNGDLQAALKWLEKDMAESGAKKAEKIKGRVANEGLISLSVASGGRGSRMGTGNGAVRAAIIELNCESDFVARTDDFGRLANSIARTVAESAKTPTASFTSLVLPDILQLPLFDSQKTIEASILDIIARIGENISLRRATAISYVPEPTLTGEATRVGCYAHNASSEFPLQGKIAAMSTISLRSPKLGENLSNPKFIEDLERMDYAVARQVVGFNPTVVGDATSSDEMHLYAQPFMMHGGPEASMLVRDVLAEWRRTWELQACNVDGFVRWQVGEEI
ncbi:elongation factor TS-domain-containing protein [Mucidula mucida]|nr:elongation factor TS-domain-containing protein [Mucidula mucida]